MKISYKKVSIAAFCVLLFTLLPLAQAETIKGISYGDVVSAFQTLDYTHEGRIWFPEDPLYYEDAHFIMYGITFDVETVQEATFYYNMDAGFLFQLYGPGYDGVFLPTIKTALKRTHFYDPPSSGPEPTCGFAYADGVLFKPGDLPVGLYTVVYWIYNYYYGMPPFAWFAMDFEIMEYPF